MLLSTPVFANSTPKPELLELSNSLYVDKVAYDLSQDAGLKCVDYFQDSSEMSKDDKSEIRTTQDCEVIGIKALPKDNTNIELSLSYILDGQEIIVKIRQNYTTQLKVGQKVKAGEVIGVFDEHVRIGANIICISAYANGVAIDTAEYIKGL